MDRFTFTLGNDGPPILGTTRYVFLVKLDLVYDEDDKILSTPPLAFMAGPASDIMAFTQCADPRDVYIQNRSVVDALGEFEGVANQSLENVRASLSESLVPTLVEQISNASSDADTIEYFVGFLHRIAHVDDGAMPALRQIASNDPRQEVRELARQKLTQPVETAADPDEQ